MGLNNSIAGISKSNEDRYDERNRGVKEKVVQYGDCSQIRGLGWRYRMKVGQIWGRAGG